MKDLKPDCRRMLSEGMALASASLLSAKGRGTPQALTNDALGPARGQPEFIEDEDSVWAAEHAPFRTAFLAWLDESRERFALPISAQIVGPMETVLHTPNLHPALSIALSYDGCIGTSVNWNGVFWDMLTDLDVSAEPTDDGAGWHDDTLIPECKQIYPTREACWRDVGFESLLDWFNNEYAPATHLVLFGSEGCDNEKGWTTAHLARDGILLRTKFTIEQNGSVRHLLPLQHVRNELIA